jgi:HK97 family phage major capsid protein
MNEEIKALQTAVVEITRVMKEKADAGYSAEVTALSTQLTDIQKSLADRKHTFAVASQADTTTKEMSIKSDELFIASALCQKKDGSFDRKMYEAVSGSVDYVDATKAFGDVLANNTGTAADGGAWIPTAFSSQLQSEIFLKLEIAGLFSRINMPAPTFVLPFSPARMVAAAVAEAGAPTKVKGVTQKLTFTANKLMSNVEFTDELDQDSIVAILPFIRKQLIDGYALSMEAMSLNGDTGTTTTMTAYTGEDCRKYVKGLRADALGNTATVAMGGTKPTDSLMRDLRAKMGKYGKNPSELAYIVDIATYNAMLKYTGYQAIYQYGAGAVVCSGELGRLDNIPIIVTELLPQIGQLTISVDPKLQAAVDATGKWHTTTAGNVSTNCVLANKNGYMWGDRNAFGLETFRNPFNQTLNLIGSQRLDFQKVLASTDPTSAMGINIV